MSNRSSAAFIFASLLLIAGIFGLIAVGTFWVSAGCPHPDYKSCPNGKPMSLRNATFVIVGTVVSTGVLVIGALIAFMAAYFPDPMPSLSRRVSEARLDDTIRRSYPPPPPPPGQEPTEK